MIFQKATKCHNQEQHECDNLAQCVIYAIKPDITKSVM